MPDDSPLIRSMRAAVAATPDDVPLRLHLAELLLDAGQDEAAVAEAAVALQHAPGDAEARALMRRAMGPAGGPGAGGTGGAGGTDGGGRAGAGEPPGPSGRPEPPGLPPEFDWHAAEQEVRGVVPPRFVTPTPHDERDEHDARDGHGDRNDRNDRNERDERDDGGEHGGHGERGEHHERGERGEPRRRGDAHRPTGAGAGRPGPAEPPLATDGADTGDLGAAPAWDVETPQAVRLADVGGMQAVKDRLEAAFLAPLRNPELRRLYGKQIRGGLLLYGPPGCGKTFIARAVAGELGAAFLPVAISDVLDMWIGRSERNIHDIFRTARGQAPCVVFLDELDALGAKRSRMHHSGLRNVVNQLLSELDGVDGGNDGVFVLAATNVPWDVDLALRRPGRLDRTLLVVPPDAPAREAILRYHLRARPIASVDLGKLVKATDGFSGADLAHVCDSAAETALLDSARTGQVRMIGMPDLLGAARSIRPSSEEWFAAARNVALFANDGGGYDDLLAYLKRKRKL